MMKNEADALRHEVNEWRARANMPFVDEPMRSDAFSIVIRGELEFEAGDMVDMEEAEDGEESSGSNGGVYGGRQYVGEPAAYTEEPVDYSLLQRQQQEHSEMIAHAQMLPPFGHTVLHPSAPSRPVPHPAGYPMNPAHHQAQVTAGHYYTPSPGVVNPAIAPYENPAIGYDHQAVIQQDMGAKWAMEKRQQILHAQQMRQGSW
ncbi:hypothetical protein B0H10DRAFT_1409 [Mycena sp. CBHHK59/15]|nr:hypothetical protein B0H10DRAFT_1409 [Mycena sp. CBHHK59/15]